MHHDAIYDARKEARDELTRNLIEAAKFLRLLKSFEVDLNKMKTKAICHLRSTLGCGLKDAKDAWEIVADLAA